MKNQKISPSIEVSIFTIQDQAVTTPQIQEDIMKEPVDGKFRLYANKDETYYYGDFTIMALLMVTDIN